MRGAFVPVVLTVAILVLSGCAGKTQKVAPTTSTTAPPPAPKADTGSISGTIVSEESAPIPGAAVALLQTTNQTTSDGAGKFVFNGLVPGKYAVTVSALGFDTIAKTVDVNAGEVAEVHYTLKKIEVKPDPYVITLPFKGMIQCSANPVYALSPCAGVTGEDKSIFTFHIEPANLKEVVEELVWTPSTPGTAAQLEMDLCDYVPSGQSQGKLLCFDSTYNSYQTTTSPNVVRLSDVPAKDYETFEAGAGAGEGNGPDNQTVAIQQSFDLYVSMCYIAPCADAFSAVPK